MGKNHPGLLMLPWQHNMSGIGRTALLVEEERNSQVLGDCKWSPPGTSNLAIVAPQQVFEEQNRTDLLNLQSAKLLNCWWLNCFLYKWQGPSSQPFFFEMESLMWRLTWLGGINPTCPKKYRTLELQKYVLPMSAKTRSANPVTYHVKHSRMYGSLPALVLLKQKKLLAAGTS